MSKPSVFLSHTHRDRALAKKIGSALEHLGLEAFNPARDVQPGEHWRKAIQAAIKRADALIMLAVTPELLSSSWMGYEAGIADALGKPLIVLLPNKYSVKDLPADLASTQIVDFDPQAPERAAHEIAARLAMA